MIINETPLRTSKNYGINNIDIDENLIKTKISPNFKNVIIDNCKNDNLIDLKENIKLKYGLGETLTNNSINNSNFKKEIIIDKNTTVEFIFDEDDTLLENLKIRIKENKDVTLTIKYISKNEKNNYHNGIIKTILEKNAKAKIIIINLLNKKSDNFLSIENVLEENANLDYGIIMLGSKTNIINYYTSLSDNSLNNLKTIYISNKEDLTDLNYIIDLYGKNTIANMEVEGAIDDNAKKNFKGTINFIKGSINSRASENENTLILSENARSKSLPMMLCEEEKVIGNHSTSTLRIDKNKLFYLMSRGIDEKEARKMIVRARFNKCIDMINDETIKEEIEKIIEERI